MVLGLVLSLAHLLLSARGHVAEFEGDSLTTILESASLPTLIEFYAPWCQHCRAFEPILERVSGAVGGHMAVVRVNGEQFGAVADEWRVQSYPTLVFVPSGVVHRHPDATIEYEGSLLEKDVLDWISHAMRHAIHLKHFADLSTPEADKQNLKPPPPPSFTDMLPNQSNEFFLRLENLRRSNYLCDAVLVPSGNPVAIASHAVVLAATSPVLAALLGASNNDDTNSDADSSVLDRIDVSVDANHQVEVNFSRIGFDQSTIEALVEFAYTRSFSSSRCESESLPSITRALELLEIREAIAWLDRNCGTTHPTGARCSTGQKAQQCASNSIFAFGLGGTQTRSTMQLLGPADEQPFQSFWSIATDAEVPERSRVRTGAGGGLLHGALVVVGGSDADGAIWGDGELWELMSEKWLPIAPMRHARAFFGFATVDERYLYVVGGIGDDGAGLNSIERFDAASQKWSIAATLPAARAGCSAAVVEGVLYVIGGLDDAGRVLASVEALDTTTGVFLAPPPPPLPEPRSAHATASLGALIFVAGGLTQDGSNANDLFVLDAIRRNWQRKQPMKTGRSMFGMGAIGERALAVIGGSSALNDAGQVECEMYDILNDVWREMKPLGVGLEACFVVALH